ncbi:MAG: hypothetical protein HYV26_20805 [Candidatus Hydrogenedentes bacterium]|nr:hypothetical protein [Candidatus Hydrogenedentota bacterium]
MADDFFDYVNPVAGRAPIERVENQVRPQERGRQPRSIAGRISSVYRGHRHSTRGHMLDLTVGADEFTEIVVRVPPGIYNNLEGKRAVLYVDE